MTVETTSKKFKVVHEKEATWRHRRIIQKTARGVAVAQNKQ